MLELLENRNDFSYDNFSYQYDELVKNKAFGDNIVDQESLKEILDNLNNAQMDSLKSELETLDKDSLYMSLLHGPDHIERTLFWSFILSEAYLSTDDEKRIALDAAKYHDIGRRNDFEDRLHGLLSAETVSRMLNYKKEDDKNILCAAIELHSLSDEEEQKMILKYGIKDVAKFSRIWKILKDADGLDRVRLSLGITRISALNPDYLRLEKSKHFIKASHELCAYYKDNELENKKRTFIS